MDAGRCIPTTCAAQGKDCGPISDGCGHWLFCGAVCTAGKTCGGAGTPNVCGTCTPTTCTALGKNCGTVSDGCGNMLSCGACIPPQSCGAGGAPNVCGLPSAPDAGCGNHVCEIGESCASCTQDCGGCPLCGNSVCDVGETWQTCAFDCGPTPGSGWSLFCGNNTCDPGEAPSTCARDCDAGSCGNMICESGETCLYCPSDCGQCPYTCGNRICDPQETCLNCGSDCGITWGLSDGGTMYTCSLCGNQKCEPTETCSSCAQDCGACPVCPNGTCDLGETCSSCAQDCLACTTCGSLESRLSITDVSIAPDSVRPNGNGGLNGGPDINVKAAATPAGGTAIAWAGTQGIGLAVLNASAQRVFPDRVFNGHSVEALAVTADRVALLYDRNFPGIGMFGNNGAEVYFAQVNLTTGAVLSDTRLFGDCNLERTPGCDVGGAGLGQGFGRTTVVWNGAQFVIYLYVNHNWAGTTGTHEGDMIYFVDTRGVLVGIGWTWGCSHSYVETLVLGTAFSAYCEGDSAFSSPLWNTAFAVSNASPGLPQELGVAVSAANTSWLIYGAEPMGHTSEDIALAHVLSGHYDSTQTGSSTGAVLSTTWLAMTAANESMPRLAAFDRGLLAGWFISPNQHWLVALDATGAQLGAPAKVSAPFGSQFFTWPNSDVGWVRGELGTLRLVRIGACR